MRFLFSAKHLAPPPLFSWPVWYHLLYVPSCHSSTSAWIQMQQWLHQELVDFRSLDISFAPSCSRSLLLAALHLTRWHWLTSFQNGPWKSASMCISRAGDFEVEFWVIFLHCNFPSDQNPCYFAVLLLLAAILCHLIKGNILELRRKHGVPHTSNPVEPTVSP